MRRQENHFLRQGLALREIRVGGETDWTSLRKEIEALSKNHIRRTAHGCELAVFEGSLDRDNFTEISSMMWRSPERFPT